MSIASQVLAYVKVVTWPLTVVLALVLFRTAIRRLLSGVEEFEGFGIKAKIRQQVADGIDSANRALADSQVSIVPSAARRISLGLTAIISKAESALRVSSWLARPDTGIGDDSPEAMKSYLTWLDTAVTVLRISEIPHCRSLEFPRGRAVRWAWDELTGLSSPVLLAG